MAKYIIKRILLLIPIMMCVVLIVYSMLYTTIGANKRAISSRGNGDWLDRVYDRLGIQDTFVARYLRYCYNVFFKLDFGEVRLTRTALLDDIRWRISFTLKLTISSFVVATVLGIVIGMAAAINRDNWADNIFMFIITLLSSVPSYTFALVLVLLFVLELDWLPLFGFTRPGWMVMPTIALSVSGIASTARLTRSSALEVMGQPYVTALRAKGLKERSVIYIHVLKNAVMPVIANLGTVLSQLLCGSMVVERFFSIPGIGMSLLGAVTSRDNLTLMGTSIVLAFLITLANLLTDLLYTAVNPRVRAQYVRSRKGEPV